MVKERPAAETRQGFLFSVMVHSDKCRDMCRHGGTAPTDFRALFAIGNNSDICYRRNLSSRIALQTKAPA
ncbi:hypothetical protein Desti_0990 [Desulfomonile tiedjei DSM 6799]|uniref:Uncharacterized protein n=1 Tax=Desulfomonile tiedjei (strain ATCC 49306 / DSM 6799 / DCB-1) TaxID=706587 RepID=I4C2B7_DESTA|nr:hypothetical protein Desti_0990 [Desulfomonile tiedjei DSM 6799]